MSAPGGRRSGGGRWPAGTALSEVLLAASRAGFAIRPGEEERLQLVDTDGQLLARRGLALVWAGDRLALFGERGAIGRARWPRRAPLASPESPSLRSADLARGRLRERLQAEVGDAELRPGVRLVRQSLALDRRSPAGDPPAPGQAGSPAPDAWLLVLRTDLPAAPDPLVIDLRGGWRVDQPRAASPDVVAALRPLGFGKGPLPLSPDAPAADAVRRVLGAQVDRMRAEEPGARAGSPDALHDWRVALRSTRALLALLGDTLPARPVRRARRRLRWLQQQTGRLRDLDVLRERVQAPGTLDDLSWAQVSSWLDEQRRVELDRVMATLDGRRHQRVMERLRRLCAHGEAAGAPIGLLTRLRLHEGWRTLIAGGRAIHTDSPAEALHDLRKEGKRLRYLIELLGGVLPEAPARALVKRLKGLQDVLGRFQDEDVQLSLLDGVPGAEQMRASIAAEHETTRAAFDQAFRTFDTTEVQDLVRALTRP